MKAELIVFASKQLKEYLRSPSSLFWTMGWPIFWVLIMIYVFLAGVPEPALPYVRGSVTVSMIAFGLATVGMVGLASSIAHDRDGGLYLKLSSMPISGWGEVLGRILGSLIYGAVTLLAILAIGVAVGSKFEASTLNVLASLPFFVVLLLSASGIGLIISNSVKGRAVEGIAVALLVGGCSVSGVFAPYASLPDYLKLFSKLYPISASMHVINRLLLVKGFAWMHYDFDPSSPLYMAYTLAVSIGFFVAGILFHKAMARKRALQ
ncbi:MAG: ABC transporter permease [Thaumarchaeota archaeon]|nr:ABC transporter permease [Nitrososphaerota archaeon]